MTASELPAGPPVGAEAPLPAADNAEVIPDHRFDMAAARELRTGTAELLGTKRELLELLSEYRVAVFAVAFEGGRDLTG